MTSKQIIAKLPYRHPFLFVDEIIEVDDDGITGSYWFDPKLDFYKGHFIDHPITPGVILTETMAQIGLVAFGIYLQSETEQVDREVQIALTSSEVDFYKPVLPGEKVIVKSKKDYFRFKKMKCSVEMWNADQELVCRGKIAGMIDIKL